MKYRWSFISCTCIGSDKYEGQNKPWHGVPNSLIWFHCNGAIKGMETSSQIKSISTISVHFDEESRCLGIRTDGRGPFLTPSPTNCSKSTTKFQHHTQELHINCPLSALTFSYDPTAYALASYKYCPTFHPTNLSQQQPTL